MESRLNPFYSTPVAIIIGAVIVSMAILINGGYIKLGKLAGTTLPGPAGQTAPAVSPGPAAKVNVAEGHLPLKGLKTAKVQIVEFADFRCPFCDKFFKDVEPQLIKDYVDSGKASFAFRHFEFLGPASIVAGNAAECANEQEKFWEFHDYLYQNQPSESDTSMYTTDNMTTAAGKVGLNTDQFKSCLGANKYQKQVDQDYKDGQAAGVNGTPATFINGNLVSGAQPYANFKSIIDSELAK